MSRSASRERTASSSSENERRILNSTNIKAWDDKAAAKNLRAFMLAVARIEEKFDRDVRSLNRELVELKGSLNALTLSVNEACVALQAQGLRTTAEDQGEQGGPGGAGPNAEEQYRRLSSMEEEANSDDEEEGGPRDHVAMLQGLPQLESFTGEGNEPFSHWLRRFNDYAEAQEKAWNDVDKLRKLKAYLGGGPREKWDEFTADEKATFAAASAKLTTLYENAFSKDIAKMSLSRCRHRPGESINEFVERLRKLVKAATIGSTNELFKDRFLEEFLDRLDDEIGGQQRQYQGGNYRNYGGNGRQGGSYGNSYGNSYGSNPNGFYRSDRNYSQGRNDQYGNDWRNSAYPTAPRNQGRSDSRDRGRYSEARSAERSGRHDRSNSRERRREEGDRSRPNYERTSGSQDRVYSVEAMPVTQSLDSQVGAVVPLQLEPAPCTGCERLKEINKKIEKAAHLSEKRPDFVFAITEDRAEFLEWRKSIMAKKQAEAPPPDVSDEDSPEMEEIDYRYFKRMKGSGASAPEQVDTQESGCRDGSRISHA